MQLVYLRVHWPFYWGSGREGGRWQEFARGRVFCPFCMAVSSQDLCWIQGKRPLRDRVSPSWHCLGLQLLDRTLWMVEEGSARLLRGRDTASLSLLRGQLCCSTTNHPPTAWQHGTRNESALPTSTPSKALADSCHCLSHSEARKEGGLPKGRPIALEGN